MISYVVQNLCVFVYLSICAAQSNLQGRHCLAVVGSQPLVHKDLAKPVLFCLSLDNRIWQGRNQTTSSSRARKRETSIRFVTLMDPGGCTSEVWCSVADICLAVGLCQYNCDQNVLASNSKWTL